MKTSKIIVAALCSVMAFSACNKQTADKYVCPEDWVYDETKGAPIQILGKSISLETKAAIDPVDGTLPDDVHFGVFGLGVNHADPTSEEVDMPVIFKDLMGDGANAMDATVYYDTTTQMYLADLKIDGFPVYYPVFSLTDYTFYGFHVGEEADNTVLDFNEAGYYEKAIDSYGYTDVLWAKAASTPFGTEPALTGFNAKYVRAIKAADRQDLLPTFDFSHQTACFEFRLRASDEAAETSFLPQNANVRITSAIVEGLKETATLVVTGDNEGQIVEGDDVREPEAIDCGDGYYPTVDGTVISDGFFVKAESIGNIKLTVVLDQRPVANEVNNRTIVLTGEQILNIFKTKKGADYQFEAGRRYTMDIVVNQAMEIQIGVTLQEWEDEDPEEIFVVE